VKIEETLTEKEIETNAKNIGELLREIDVKIENAVIVKNNHVVVDLNEEIKEGDEIEVLEAVGGG